VRPGPLFPLFILAFFFLIDLYAFQAVKTLTIGYAPRVRQTIHLAYWAVFVGLMASFIYGMATIPGTGRIPVFFKWALNLLITLLVTKIVLIAVLFGEDIYRTFTALVNWGNRLIAGESAGSPLMPDRRKFISQVGIALAGIPFTSFLYGITRGKYDYRVHRHTVYFPDLPEAFDGFTITQISDVHAGSFDNPRAVQRGIELINAQKSDLFVFTGDLVNNKAEELDPYLDHFAQIRAPYGQFSILGNHDYGDYYRWPSEHDKRANFQQLKEHHAALGFRLLLDENAVIEKGGQKIAVLGVENWGKGFGERGDLQKAMRGLQPETFKILLSHDPTHWEYQVKSYPVPVHLTLSGHTHGMQMGIEIPGWIKWSPVKFRYPHWAGLAEEAGRKLYINRGFGFLGFSGRVGIWPEITVLELRKGQASAGVG
jgi:predicted MPP superfamily phosphohydrolase